MSQLVNEGEIDFKKQLVSTLKYDLTNGVKAIKNKLRIAINDVKNVQFNSGDVYNEIKLIFSKIGLKDFRKAYYKTDDYYLGFDKINGMHFICMNNIMMIDIDYDKSKFKNMSDIMVKTKQMAYETGDIYRVYSSRGGAHIFVMNRTFDPKKKETIDYMLKFDCDLCYTFFTYERGWAVRLNPKNNEDKMYSHVDDVYPDTFKSYIFPTEPLTKIIKIVEKHIDYSIALSNVYMKDKSSYFGYDDNGILYD
jgi:hypothetical protein